MTVARPCRKCGVKCYGTYCRACYTSGRIKGQVSKLSKKRRAEKRSELRRCRKCNVACWGTYCSECYRGSRLKGQVSRVGSKSPKRRRKMRQNANE